MNTSTSYVSESAFEHRFWLQILGDHSRFIYNSLAPTENELLAIAGNFINVFDNLLQYVRTGIPPGSWTVFASRVMQAAASLKKFKLEIIRRHLQKKVNISLTPTFLNHMVNEVEEYLQNLGYLVQGQCVPVKSPVHHHLLWLPDATGHAEYLRCSLDASQTHFRQKAKDYRNLWSKKHSEALEYAGFLRTGIPLFPSLNMFDRETACEMARFKNYLEALRAKVQEAAVTGTFDALIPDHMAREECYYLYRLHRSDPASVPRPCCDPGHPRINP